MILNGKKLSGPNVELIVFPRTDENGKETQIVFKAQAILDFEDFDRLCPKPKPPSIIKRGEGLVYNPEDPNYKKAIEQWVEKRGYWITITSLRATEGLEWETVDYSKPESWGNYRKELRDSGFGEFELMKLTNGVAIANCLDEDKIELARKRFLAGTEEEQSQPSSLNGEQKTTLSGEPVNE